MTVERFVADHEGCTLTDIIDGCGLPDAAAGWEAVFDAERGGTITMNNSDGGRWRFYLTPS